MKRLSLPFLVLSIFVMTQACTTTSQANAGNAVISSVSPSQVVAGSSTGFTLSVYGSGFVGNAVVLWNGSARATRVVSKTQLQASISSTDIQQAGSAAVTVDDQRGSSAPSNSVFVTIQPAASGLSVSPTTAVVTAGNSQQFSATVTGATNASVSWMVNGALGGNSTVGTISGSGLYKAPNVSSNSSVKVTVVDGANQANASVTIVPAATPVSVSISPTSANVQVGRSQQFTATVSGTTNTAVNWLVGGIASGNSSVGTISPAGLYTAPSNAPTNTVTVTAQSAFASASAASATVTLTATTAAGQLTASTSTLSFGDVDVGTGSAQSVTFTNSGNANANITISNVILSGGAGFNVTGMSGGLILGRGQTATLNVTFAPGATGNVTGSVSISSDAANSPVAINLSGTGLRNVSPNNTAVPNAFFGATLFSSSFPLRGGMVIGTLGKRGGITGHWLEPTCDGGTDPNNSCYTLSGLTNYVNLAQANGLTIVYDFSIPGWMCGAGSNTNCRQLPTNLTWLSNFATAIATKYKGQIKYYETGNEVNVDAESWVDSCANLVLMNNTIYAAIKAVDPTAIVGAPNMAAFNGTIAGGGACVGSPVAAGNSASIWLNNFLQTQDRNGRRPSVDTVGVHTYASQVSTSLDGCDWSNNKLHCAAAPLLHLYNSFRTVMTNNGMTSVPLLVTEGGFGVDNNSFVGAYGCSTNVNYLTACLTDAQQVAYVGRWLVLSASTWADGNGQLANWYAYDIDWGSLDGSNGMNLENASAYGQMETWIKGAIFSQQCHTGLLSTVFVCDFVSGTGKQSEIIFNDDSGATVEYTLPDWAGSYQPLLGSSTVISGGTVKVGDVPILLQ